MKYLTKFDRVITALDCICMSNTLRLRQSGRHFTYHIFKCILLNETACILLKFSFTFVPEVWINNIPALVEIMAWRQPGDKPLSEPIVVNLLMHICVTRPLWVKSHEYTEMSDSFLRIALIIIVCTFDMTFKVILILPGIEMYLRLLEFDMYHLTLSI